MAFKLVVADVVEFPVRLTVTDGATPRQFSFTIQGKRTKTDQLDALVRNDTMSVPEFLRERLTGWRGQTLVVDDAGQPAAFGPEALDIMLSLPGAANAVLATYFEACSARGREKN